MAVESDDFTLMSVEISSTLSDGQLRPTAFARKRTAMWRSVAGGAVVLRNFITY